MTKFKESLLIWSFWLVVTTKLNMNHCILNCSIDALWCHYLYSYVLIQDWWFSSVVNHGIFWFVIVFSCDSWSAQWTTIFHTITSLQSVLHHISIVPTFESFLSRAGKMCLSVDDKPPQSLKLYLKDDLFMLLTSLVH